MTRVKEDVMIYTVFFDTDIMPQDFNSYTEAKIYAEEVISNGLASSYTIEAS